MSELKYVVRNGDSILGMIWENDKGDKTFVIDKTVAVDFNFEIEIRDVQTEKVIKGIDLKDIIFEALSKQDKTGDNSSHESDQDVVKFDEAGVNIKAPKIKIKQDLYKWDKVELNGLTKLIEKTIKNVLNKELELIHNLDLAIKKGAKEYDKYYNE